MLVPGGSGIYLYAYCVFYYRCASPLVGALMGACCAYRAVQQPTQRIALTSPPTTLAPPPLSPPRSVNLEIEGPVPQMLYFGYMGLVAAAFTFITGVTGYLATFWFVRKIYGAIKVD